MPISLTTPHSYEPGHGQAPIVYPEVKIVQIDWEIVNKRMVLHMQYGETIGGDWIGAPDMHWHPEPIFNFEGTADGDGGWIDDPDPAYDLFWVALSASSTQTLLYDENSDAFYQYLLDDGRYVGAIT